MSLNLHQIRSFIPHFFIAKRKGHGVHSPFVYQLCEEVFYNKSPFYYFSELSRLRRQLPGIELELEIQDHGAGSKAMPFRKRKIRDIVEKGISTRRQSEMLCRLINLLRCNMSLELGTSVGLNTLYMAAANRNGKVISIEGSGSLHVFARNLAKNPRFNNIHFIHDTFDEALPRILEGPDLPDLVYMDGNHTYEATLRYFGMLLEKIQDHSVIVIDDIYWSPGMTRAWKEICGHPRVTLSIDTFYAGIVFFRKEFREKAHYRLYV